MSAKWFEDLVDGVPDSAVPDDGVLALPAVVVPIAPFGVPMVMDQFSTVVGCAGCSVGPEPHGPDCPVKSTRGVM